MQQYKSQCIQLENQLKGSKAIIEDFAKAIKELKNFELSQAKEIVEALGPRSPNTYSMYKGSQILELEACGLELEAYCLGLDACYLELAKLGA
jgi:hypothetical protein